MKLIPILPLALAGAALCGSALAQNQFPGNGQTVTLGFTRQAEDFVIPTTDLPRLIKVALRGGSGGNATATTWSDTQLGGRGARVETIFSVGTGPNDLQPGGVIRFIVGTGGAHGSGSRDANGGGGGGTGLLYRAPSSSVFEPLLVAGAGGGATASQSASDPGRDGNLGPCGQQCGGNGGSAGSGAGGGGLYSEGASQSSSGAQGGRRGFPAGGAGGQRSSAWGGWGCGGGGAAGLGGGGGGGFFGGSGGGRQIEGGGGGCYMSSRYSLAPRTGSYDSDRGNGYAIFTPLLGSGESIEDPLTIADPSTGTGVVYLQGDTSDNIRTTPAGWDPPCMPGVTPSADEWYVFTNTASCARELLIQNRSKYSIQLTLDATPGSFANARCITLPRGSGIQLLPAGNSSTFIRVSTDPSQYPFLQAMPYDLAMRIDVQGSTQTPTIITQPENITVDIGAQADPVLMSVVAQNASRYQWLKRNLQGGYDEVPGQTTADLTIPFVQCSDTSTYKCRVMSGCFGSVETDEAILFAGPVGGVRRTGTGCPADARFVTTTFYEYFRENGNPTGFDMAGQSLRFTPVANGWRMSDGPGFDLNYQNGLGLGDDQLSRNHALGFSFPLRDGSSTTAIDIESNGWIGLVTGAHARWQSLPTRTTFLQGPARIAACWQDLNPAAGGDVYFDTFADRALITWFEVPEFNSGRLNTFQVQLFPNGEFVLSYGSVFGARVPMVGFSTGGVTSDPGMIDINATQSGPELRGTVYPPTLGESFDLRVTAEGPTAGGLVLVGFAPLSLDLTLFGLPGCTLRTSGDASFSLPAFSAGVSTITLNVPSDPSLLSFELHAQAAVNEPGANSLGLVLSNGARITLGGCRY